jgi:uncharacterized protein (DUF849 family)
VPPGRAARRAIVEVRLNEYTLRDRNPHVPWSPAELAADAAACREAGAALVHFHARDPETGAPSHDASVYADAIRRIRAACDALVVPTLGASTIRDPLERCAHIPILAADPLTRPDLAPLDLGSINVDAYVPGRGFLVEDLVYFNPVRGIREQIRAISSAGVRMETALWTVGSARLLGALLELGDLPEPTFAELVVSDLLLSTHPATPRGLAALVDALPPGRRIPWVALAPGSNVLPLFGTALQLGGGIAVGLGDWAYPELGKPTNAEVVHEAVRMLRACGAEPASPDEARELLGLA